MVFCACVVGWYVCYDLVYYCGDLFSPGSVISIIPRGTSALDAIALSLIFISAGKVYTADKDDLHCTTIYYKRKQWCVREEVGEMNCF